MKKIMVMLAAVSIAVATHAASVYWTCTNVKDATGTAVSGVAYFVNAAALSQSDVAKLDGATAFTTALEDMYSWTPSTAGKYTKLATEAVENATLGVTDATTGVNAYLIIFDTATITDNSKYYLTDIATFDSYSGTETAQVKWGSQSSASTAAGAWSAVSVPEPTSGLLILVGGALLALRRRRA